MSTILTVGFPFAAIGPDAVGGAEQIASALERAIHRAGHRSLVLAHEGSQTAGLLGDPTVRAFHRDAGRRLLARGRLVLRAVRMHGEISCIFTAWR